MSRFTHVPIFDAYATAGVPAGEFEQRQADHFDRAQRAGRIRVLTVSTDPPATPYVSDNRWVVDCSVCGSGIAVARDRGLWSCWECGTGFYVDWPEDRELAAVEEVLRERTPRLRSYFPTIELAAARRRLPDTAESLAEENDEYGIDHHSWTTPRTWVTSEVVTAALLNTHLRDNLNETTPALVTTAGDLVVADGANSLVRLPKGTDNYYLRTISGSVVWST